MKFLKYLVIGIILFSLLLIGCTSAPEEPTDNLEKTTEKTKAEPEPATEAEPESETGPKKVVKTIDLLTKESSFFSDGVLDEYTELTYEEEGTNIISEELYTDENELIEKRNFIYENGFLAKEEVYDSSENLQSYYVYKYDDDGNLIAELMYDNEDELQLKSTYEYDTTGKRVKWSIYSGDEALFSYTEYSWEGDKNSKTESFTPAGELDVYFEYEFDPEGNRVKGTEYEANGDVLEFRTYEYENGNLVEEIVYRANGSVKRKVRYTNDDRGNPVEILYLNGADKVQERVTKEYIQRDIIEYIEE